MSSEIFNFISIQDNYTENTGKINLTTHKHDLFLDGKLVKKSDLNIKISTNDIIEIINHIISHNRYIIHIINITYDTTPSHEVSSNIEFINSNKSIIIDNCGNIYIGAILYPSVKNVSMYPLKANLIKNMKIVYPEEIFVQCLPDFLIYLIKNISAEFIFRSIDYTINIIEIIKNTSNISYYFTEFNNEFNKNIELIKQKNNMLINIIDTEILDYKKKHDKEVLSLHDVIKYLEHENTSQFETLNELGQKNLTLSNTVYI